MLTDIALPTEMSEPVLALLADRDADTRSMYAESLRLARYEIEEAADGREALAKAVTRLPDIVVTETRLAGISGLELCRLLREDTLTRTIPILVVTADAYARDLELARHAGASRVLVKPCLPDVLLAEIRQLLGASAALRERSQTIREKSGDQLSRAVNLIERSLGHRPTLARSHNRHQTATPPLAPPPLVCPECDAALAYDHSHIGGVSARHSEQWDYYVCSAGCGTFQYRQRTRKLRKV